MMAEDRKLLVGFDLCNDYSQISCYSRITFEPESICYTASDEDYMIPTVLGVRKDTGDWFLGEDALKLAKAEKVFLIDNLIERIINKEPIYVFGQIIAPDSILEKFFRKCLSILKRYYPNEMIEKLVVTVPVLDVCLIQNIYQALANLSLERDRVLVQSHLQSAVYFAMSQSRDLWMNNVGIFDFEEKGLQYYQLNIDRRHYPLVVTIEHKDLSDTIGLALVREIEDKKSLCYVLENTAKTVLYRQLVTTLYMTGKGFEGNWADDVLKHLCVGRRVFKGQNLYTKGACYFARQQSKEAKTEEFCFVTKEMVPVTISVEIYKDAMMRDYPLITATTQWYDASCSCHLIVDDTSEIILKAKDLLTKEIKNFTIPLDGFEKRPPRMTRVELTVQFVAYDEFQVIVRDRGFGSYYQENGFTITKHFKLERKEPSDV